MGRVVLGKVPTSSSIWKETTEAAGWVYKIEKVNIQKGRKVNMDLLTLLSRDEALENGVKPLPNNLIYFVTPNVHPKLRS